MPVPPVSVIIPALNESRSIVELFERVKAVMDGLDKRFEFIVVDDGSNDDTGKIVLELAASHANVGLLSHHKNHGKSMAIMQGIAISSGDPVIFMDADLQDQPEDIPKFLEALDQGADLVGGWRQQRHDPPAKRMLSHMYNRLVTLITKQEFHDINCGFKAMRRSLAEKLDLRGDMHRLIPVIARSYGYTCREIPISHQPRKYGDSRYKLIRHRGILDLIFFSLSHTTQTRPFHLFSELGFFLWVFGILALLPWLLDCGGLLGRLSLIAGGWSILAGTLLPLFGFNLEIETGLLQNRGWRDRLIKQVVPPRLGE